MASPTRLKCMAAGPKAVSWMFAADAELVTFQIRKVEDGKP